MPGATIPSVLANEFTEATTKLYLSSLIYLGLILIAVTLAVQFLAVLLIRRLGRREGTAHERIQCICKASHVRRHQ